MLLPGWRALRVTYAILKDGCDYQSEYLRNIDCHQCIRPNQGPGVSYLVLRLLSAVADPILSFHARAV